MRADVATWITLAVLALAAEGSGLAGFHHWRPLTMIIRGEMRKDSAVTGAVAAFLLWLVYHFLVQTWIPGQGS